MKKTLSILSLVLVFALALTACGGASSSSAAAPASAPASTAEPASAAEPAPAGSAEGKNVTMILKNLTNPFFISVKEGAEKAAGELGINLTVLAPLQADNNEEQSQMVDQAIASQTDLLIMCPSDSEGIVPAIQRVAEAGIPIVNLNTLIGGDEVLWKSFVAIENYDAGYQTTKALCELMGGKGEIMVIEGVTGAQTSIDRVKGATDAIAEYPDIQIVAQQSGDYNRAKAMDVVQNLLQANPNVNAIYCCNDEMALGAVEAVASAGKTGDILIAGCDANADARAAIQDGKMALSCDSQPVEQGYQAVMTAGKILAGETVEERVVTEMKVVSKEDLA